MNAAAKPTFPLRVLGIDPGLSDVGWGAIDWDGRERRARLVRYGVIRTAAGGPLADRLVEIERRLAAIAGELEPRVVAIEQLFFCTNVQTAMVVAHGRAACILGAAPGRELVEYTPLQIKKALTGHGRAGKMQVQMMVRAVLGLDEIPRPDHAADALAAAICHVQSLGLEGKIGAALAQIAERKADAARGAGATEVNPMKALLAQQRTRRRRR